MLDMLTVLIVLAMFTIISIVTVIITDCFHTCVEKQEEEGVIGSLIQDNFVFNFDIVVSTRSVQNIVNVSYHGTNQRGEEGLERRSEVGQAWQSRKADTVPCFCYIIFFIHIIHCF